MSDRKLLLYSKKKSTDVTFVRRPDLMIFPFDQMVSRVKYRAEHFNFEKNAESVAEIVSSPLRAGSWEECCLDRAQQLLALKKNTYFLSYSGGIDSTTMLVSILRTWPKSALSRVVIYLSHHSIYENPTFFARYLSRFPLRNSMALGLSDELESTNSILVTGELGDQLFGSDILGAGCRAFGDEILAKKFQDHAAPVLEAFTKIPGSGRALFEHLQPITAECPFPIRTTHDFFWWLNFSLKWQPVKFRFLEDPAWNPAARYGSEILHFYDTMPFQKWSLANHDLKIGKTWQSYKFTAKDFLFAFTKDPAQRELRKIQSLEKTYLVSEKRIAVASNLKPVETLEELKKYARTDD